MPEWDRDGSEDLISVIVPVYRAEKVLSQCVDSLIGQTHREIEIILVDDGSPDESGTICDRYAEKDSRVVVLHTPNGGAYAARNRALEVARGGYIAFVDADDWTEPVMLETLLRRMKDTDADIAQCEMKNEGSYAQIRTKKCGKPVVYGRGELAEAFFGEYITHGLLGKLFRAKIWEERRFDEAFYHVDAMTMAGMNEYCTRLVRTDEELYHYNTTNPGITRGRRDPKHIKSKEKLFAVFSDAAKEASSEADFFICREIPSAGRLIPPGGEITVKMAVDHVRAMRTIFARHWPDAKASEGYRAAPGMKKILWNLFNCMPVAASLLVWMYARVTGRLF